jgi:hypothetical protein
MPPGLLPTGMSPCSVPRVVLGSCLILFLALAIGDDLISFELTKGY